MSLYRVVLGGGSERLPYEGGVEVSDNPPSALDVVNPGRTLTSGST